MKQIKIAITDKLAELAAANNSVMIRRAAAECGVKHLTTQETNEIIRAFMATHHDHKLAILKLTEAEADATLSVFSRGFVTSNNTPPIEDMRFFGLTNGGDR